MPIYIKVLDHVPPMELLGHRIVWSFLLMAVVLFWSRGWKEVWRALGEKKTRWLLVGSTIVICFNWLGFIWAVYTERLSQASLGYYINPLVSVLLGWIFLGEKLRPWGKAALALATIGVLVQAFTLTEFPWIALFLAFSFGFYGLFRKVASVRPVAGLTIETGLLTPVIFIWFLVTFTHDTPLSITSGTTFTKVLLPFAGVITAVPLILFAAAAHRLKLATIGFLQYITPTMQLLLAVLAFGEEFSIAHFFSFLIIWTALFIYTYDILKRAQR